jgi:hypothetical protein
VKPPIATPGRTGRGSPLRIQPDEEATLLALPEEYTEPIDRPVEVLLAEARDLERVVKKFAGRLHARSLLDPAVTGSLARRRKHLEDAEDAWAAHRGFLFAVAHDEPRAEAEQLKSDAIAALRYFVADDAETQRRLDSIAPGVGLADLIQDLRRLSNLLEMHADRLARADLPRDAAVHARTLADRLQASGTEIVGDPTGMELMALRNRAFWWLRDALDEVRAAARYVFRNEPEPLLHFRVFPPNIWRPARTIPPPVAPAR